MASHQSNTMPAAIDLTETSSEDDDDNNSAPVDYESQRLARIKDNQAFLNSLDFGKIGRKEREALEAKRVARAVKRKKKREAAAKNPAKMRKSSRQRGEQASILELVRVNGKIGNDSNIILYEYVKLQDLVRSVRSGVLYIVHINNVIVIVSLHCQQLPAHELFCNLFINFEWQQH